MKKKLILFTVTALCLLCLCACSLRPSQSVTVPATQSETVSPAPTATPTSTPVATMNIVTPTPEVSPSPTPEATPTPTPTPSATPAPTPTPTPTTQVNSNLPRVTKSPTGETVAVNGSAQFVANYQNATLAEWHFVSPDGTRDLDYKQAATEFPTLVINGGYTKDLTLQNMPEALNGWKVYCRFSNSYGSTNTERATITVTANVADALPKVTKSPTGETVNPGGAASFVARHERAIWAVWHFVSPDGTQDITYTDIKAQFPNLTVTGGDQGTLKLSNIPAEMNGWKVYCAFRNYVGTTNTDSALITVTGQGQTGTITSATATTVVREGFTGRWAQENGRCYLEFVSNGEGSVKANITWSQSNAERKCWSMIANSERDNVMAYTDGHSWVETYSDDTTYTVSQETSDEHGSFYMQDGKLHWYNDMNSTDTVLVPVS